ncbi:iron-sulfur cluster assembly accessory protein [Pedobacter sp. P351]|jgi:iron-sulfur cluster assembly protein|uniref:HesB/IscA family protein n=1 Tax=Pedobacter superstes TaxID=3133441 RepID=UPI002F16BF14
MVTVTDKAKEKVAELVENSGLDNTYFLRVSVQGGGCSGLSYKLDFDNEEKPGDQFFEDKGVRMALDMKSFLYLAGTELDFSDGLNGKGFNFHNPNASRTCGCGESFSV